MPSDTAVWQWATYGILLTAVLVIIGCGIAFVQAIWQSGKQDRVSLQWLDERGRTRRQD